MKYHIMNYKSKENAKPLGSNGWLSIAKIWVLGIFKKSLTYTFINVKKH